MDEEDIILPVDPLALDDDNAAVIVSETDVAHSSADDDDEDAEGWLAQRYQRRRIDCNPSTLNATSSSYGADAQARGTDTGGGDGGCGGGNGGNGGNGASARENDSDSDDDAERMKDGATSSGEYYCKNMDDEDEAWVYKHMRSGEEELVRVRKQLQEDVGVAATTTAADTETENAHVATNEERKMGDTDTAEGGLDDAISINKPTNPTGENATNENSHASSSSSSSSQQQQQQQQTPTPSSSSTTPRTRNNSQQLQQARLLRPRTSDAILSCPRCFNIVCMDCQQHDRYVNQYRAMFVMNIGVDWSRRMVYDEAVGELKLDSPGVSGTAGVVRMEEDGDGDGDTAMQLEDGGRTNATLPDTIPHDTTTTMMPNGKEKEELYYSVHCRYCRLELAALDMEDEVYYFFGCIASA
mmetsp:Transcript_40749/g.85347  ORF Transcript_40749/g.85347 Transcript_40749/m.85347 type:complete len:413 (+) Transcript_40749:84-1322(+)